MMRPVPPAVHATQRLPARVEDALAAAFDVVETPAGAEGLVTTLATRVDGAYLDAAGPQLRVVANYGVGYDNVDVEAARERRITVANTPDVLTHATAELAIALMLALLRRVAEGDRLLRRRERWGWETTFMLGRGLDGLTLGIVGPGRIGRETARLGECLGMTVRTAGRGDPLEPLLAEADVVSIHCPLTTETRHLVDAEALGRMKPSAVVVNTARGPIIDEAALVAALRDGTIAGAGLDVFEFEPQVTEELLALENVVLAPHLGSATESTRVAMGMLCVAALRAVLLDGRRPANAVT